MLFRLYTPILILQVFCVYHAYKKGEQQRWFFIILIFPLIGSLFYLYHAFYSKNNLETIAETVKNTVNTNRQLELLEKEFKFSPTHANRVNLADAYVDYGRYDEAIELYKAGLLGVMADDPHTIKKLIRALYLDENYKEVLIYADLINENKIFKNSEEQIMFAWSLHNLDKSKKALEEFEAMNHSYTNFAHRKEFVRFLILAGNNQDASQLIDALENEYEHLEKNTRRDNSEVFKEIRSLRSRVR